MDTLWLLVILTVVIALAFDVVNGFHDAANSIATVVSTRVLSPKWAVLWAAFFNFVAMFIFPAAVANTISKIVEINPNDSVFVYVVLAGLLGAIVWDLLTWYWGLPTSSSHALIGGFGGAGVAYAGWNVLHWDKVLTTMKFIPLAPLIGMALGFLLMLAVLVFTVETLSQLGVDRTILTWMVTAFGLAMPTLAGAFSRIVSPVGYAVSKARTSVAGNAAATTAGSSSSMYDRSRKLADHGAAVAST